MADSDEALWTLTKRKDSYHSPYFNQSEIVWMQRAGYNLYRIRPLFKKLQPYRILYAYNGQKDEIHLLALVIKKPDSLPAHLTNGEYYDYEPNHRITQRIIDEYQNERFPMLH